MFKKTCFKLNQNLNKNFSEPIKQVLNAPISQRIKNSFKSNDDLIKNLEIPYHLRGEYLPRRPINPFKRKPLNVIYDQSHYQGFVLPSRREVAFGLLNPEEIFGLKRWRNDSPMMKEYIRIDNQICLLIIFGTVLMLINYLRRHSRTRELRQEILLDQMGIYTADDVK
jgi:hypothetical protein